MRQFALLLALLLGSLVMATDLFAARDTPLIIDHTCTNIWEIPVWAVEQAKEDLHIAYGHTSHGSQLISGMGSSGTELDSFMSANGATPGRYVWNDGPLSGALDLDNYFVSGDLGNPDRETWAQRTREYLDNAGNSDVNVVIWSWCGQVNGTESQINTYLNLMDALESDYPDIQFVYMTGHLNGTGAEGNVNVRNNQIRQFCQANNKILYDFADIESYDPDGGVNYMELMADDKCTYDSDGNGSRDENWAINWQQSHTQDVDWWASGAAHSQHLNGNLKGYAAWWLWARLAGWEGPGDQCPDDPDKTQPGQCGCGVPETDSDEDGTADCLDECPDDADKVNAGECGCGVPETDTCGGSPSDDTDNVVDNGDENGEEEEDTGIGAGCFIMILVK